MCCKTRSAQQNIKVGKGIFRFGTTSLSISRSFVAYLGVGQVEAELVPEACLVPVEDAAALAPHEDAEVGGGGEVGGAELLEQDDDGLGPRGEGELDLVEVGSGNGNQSGHLLLKTFDSI